METLPTRECSPICTSETQGTFVCAITQSRVSTSVSLFRLLVPEADVARYLLTLQSCYWAATGHTLQNARRQKGYTESLIKIGDAFGNEHYTHRS